MVGIPRSMTPCDNARQRIASRPSWSIPIDRVRPFQALRRLRTLVARHIMVQMVMP
jgi:hypothetical protein